jgi:allophanate hydrolase
VLAVSAGPSGSWCYLAVSGELIAERWSGSTSTHVRSALGGGLVRSGDRLIVEAAEVDHAVDGPVEVPALARPPSRLRVVLGPQLGRFVPGAADVLVDRPYVLTAASDRMGVRLDGAQLELDGALGIPSTPMVRGSLQVAGDGVPTLLMADHQTTGGYPTIATVIADDATRATQLRPGDAVQFVPIEPADAIMAARAAAAERDEQLAVIADRPGLRTRRLLGSNLIGGVFHPPRPRDP